MTENCENKSSPIGTSTYNVPLSWTENETEQLLNLQYDNKMSQRKYWERISMINPQPVSASIS